MAGISRLGETSLFVEGDQLLNCFKRLQGGVGDMCEFELLGSLSGEFQYRFTEERGYFRNAHPASRKAVSGDTITYGVNLSFWPSEVAIDIDCWEASCRTNEKVAFCQRKSEY